MDSDSASEWVSVHLAMESVPALGLVLGFHPASDVGSDSPPGLGSDSAPEFEPASRPESRLLSLLP